MLKRYLVMFGALAVMFTGIPQVGMAATMEELERRLDLVTEELQKMKNESAVTEAEYKSTYGFGPAASKVYSLSEGLSIGGYGEAHYTNYVSDKGTKEDQADFLRFVLYAGYKFTDNIILNSEIEFEHASTGEDGEVSLELANLDFLLDEKFNIRAGLMLLPVGITNELHEPTLFHGNDRPLVERQVIPSTWREMGVGAFGEITEGLDYKLYLVNGLDASDFDSQGIRGGRQKGSKALAEDWAVVADLDYEPVLGLNLGTSFYLGDSGQGQEFAGKKANVFTQIYEAHGQYKVKGLELKALASLVDIDDTDKVSAEVGENVPERISGWYGEVAYDVLPLIAPDTDQYFAPFVRYEQIDYKGSNEDVDLIATGVSYKPIPNVVIKADYRNFENKHKADAADEVNVGIGFIF
jgi:hypothetical protein